MKVKTKGIARIVNCGEIRVEGERFYHEYLARFHEETVVVVPSSHVNEVAVFEEDGKTFICVASLNANVEPCSLSPVEKGRIERTSRQIRQKINQVAMLNNGIS